MLRSALCLTTLLLASTATAQSADPIDSTIELKAKSAFEDGLRLLRAGQWSEAEVRFRQSLALTPRPSANYDLAFVLYKEGRARESAELLQRLLASPESFPDRQYREYAKVLLPNVLAQLSTLRLVIDPPTADVRIDGELVPLTGAERSVPLDPGTHAVEVSASGFVAGRFDFVSEAHVETERRISLTSSPDRAGPTSAPTQPAFRPPARTEPVTKPSVWSAAGPWLTMGLGAALLAGATVTGLLAKQADDAMQRACPTLRNCDSSLIPERDRAVQLGHITDALLVSGGVLVAGGVTWRILVPAVGRTDGQRAFIVASGVF